MSMDITTMMTNRYDDVDADVEDEITVDDDNEIIDCSAGLLLGDDVVVLTSLHFMNGSKSCACLNCIISCDVKSSSGKGGIGGGLNV